MKTFVIFGLVLLATMASINACNTCPPQRDPQCGFSGSCIYEFNNRCELTRYNCLKGGYFRQTDRYQCESAKKGNGRYPYCRNSGGNLW